MSWVGGVDPLERGAIVITGASSGIGAAVGHRLACPGRTLVLTGRNADALRDVVNAARARGANVDTHTFDLTDAEQVAAFATSLDRPVFALVHSAGVAHLGRVAALGDLELEHQWQVNVRAPIRLTQALLPRLRDARGTVVFVNSGAGLRANAGWGGYAASKFALRALADALREEEGGVVRVASVFPGRTATPMQMSVRRQENGTYEPSAYLTPDAVADAVAGAIEAPASASVSDVTIRPR